jgi:hypothetical protein
VILHNEKLQFIEATKWLEKINIKRTELTGNVAKIRRNEGQRGFCWENFWKENV